MTGYAAALRVLTRYASIDGVDMAKEALRPKPRARWALRAKTQWTLSRVRLRRL
jgi:hypothetical protein